MKLILKFKNINSCHGVPTIQVKLNHNLYFSGDVSEQLELAVNEPLGPALLEIIHFGKTPDDCVVANGVITQDRNCELYNITVDEYDIEELIWQSHYTTVDGEVLDKCLYFGKNGTFSLMIEFPILKWILKTRHQINGNDPYWEEDYESYTRACKLLNKLN